VRGHGAGRGSAAVGLAALVVIGGFVGLGRSAAAVEPSLPLLPTLARPSALPEATLAPLASLPVSTLLPLPTTSLPIATILPLPSASLPTASTTPRLSATPGPTAGPSPAATAVAAPGSTLAPTSTAPSRVIPATGSVGSRPAGTGLIVSDVSPERPVTVTVAAAHAVAGQLAWLVPGLVLGLPGVLLLAIVAAQLLGGAVFLGLTRRTLGGLDIDTESPTG
jgi:hypothetical protein